MNYKNKISLIIFSLLTGVLLTAFNAKKVSARCVDLYGGGQTCYEGELRVDKMVKNPSNGEYTDNLYSDNTKFSPDQEIWFKVTVKNTGKVTGEEVVQLYIRDKIASIVRPVKELKGFKKIKLGPAESQGVEFFLTNAELGFYTNEGEFVVEPGEFDVMVGTNSQQGIFGHFIKK